MAWTPDRLPDLTGQTILVTGANGGLGYETALALAARNALVVMASRKTVRSGEARDQILAQHPEASIEVRELDLSSLRSVRYFAERMRLDHPYLDAIVCNAGVMGVAAAETEDGFDRQWQINHLGHFELVRLLWGTLMANGGGRVVATTSFARHMRGDFDPDDPPIRGEYHRWKAYGQTKMANLRFAVELDRRARAAGVPVAAIVAHPGLSHTRRNTTRPARPPQTLLQRVGRWWIKRFGMDPARGAHSQIRAAADPKAKGGRLYAPRFITVGASVRKPLFPWTRSRERGEELWTVSERQLGHHFEI